MVTGHFPPSGRVAVLSGRLDAAPCPVDTGAPRLPAPAERALPRAGNRDTRLRWTLRRLPVSALPDVFRFPAPAAWGAGLCPPLQHLRPWGRLWLDAGLRPVGHCFAAPPDARLPGGPGVRSRAAAGRLAPHVRLRSHVAPNPLNRCSEVHPSTHVPAGLDRRATGERTGCHQTAQTRPFSRTRDTRPCAFSTEYAALPRQP